MNKLLFIFIISVYLSTACADQVAQSQVPASVRNVETYSVGERIVKIIGYNSSVEPQLDIEMFVPPKYIFVQRRVIDKITIDVNGRDEVLDFRNTAGVFFDKIKVDKGVVKFQVEFYFRRGSGYYLSECSVDANFERLSEPVCRYIVDRVL